MPEDELVFSADTSLLFKETQIFRMYDRKRNTLVYTAISTKIIEGSPMNSISTVPIMHWDSRDAAAH
jgi:CreA protein